MIAWGGIGHLSGCIDKRTNLIVGAIYAAFTGYLFGFIMSLSMLLTLPITIAVAYYVGGLPFDTYHAVGNVIFYLLCSRLVIRLTA